MKIIDRKALVAALIIVCGNGVCGVDGPFGESGDDGRGWKKLRTDPTTNDVVAGAEIGGGADAGGAGGGGSGAVAPRKKRGRADVEEAPAGAGSGASGAASALTPRATTGPLKSEYAGKMLQFLTGGGATPPTSKEEVDSILPGLGAIFRDPRFAKVAGFKPGSLDATRSVLGVLGNMKNWKEETTLVDAILTGRVRWHPLLEGQLRETLKKLDLPALRAVQSLLSLPDLDQYVKDDIVTAFAGLDAAQVRPRAEAILAHVPALFRDDMDGYGRGRIITAFAGVEVAQISARARAIHENAGTLFTVDMDEFDYSKIITALKLFNAAQIQAVASQFKDGVNLDQRLEVIRNCKALQGAPQATVPSGGASDAGGGGSGAVSAAHAGPGGASGH